MSLQQFKTKPVINRFPKGLFFKILKLKVDITVDSAKNNKKNTLKVTLR